MNIKSERWVLLTAGLLPVMAVMLAWRINVYHGMADCLPFWDGCMSVSRGIRSGPGLFWFKFLAMPGCLLMCAGWWLQYNRLNLLLFSANRRHRALTAMGICGAVFFMLYAVWLGTEGEVYRWMRRYGVVFYFGLTGLAHLILTSAIWQGGALKNRSVTAYSLLVWFTWVAGVSSGFKRRLTDDPDLISRLENALEWSFALLLSLCFAALAFALPTKARQADRSSQASVSGNR